MDSTNLEAERSLLSSEIETLLTPLVEWRQKEEGETGPLSRTSHTPQKVGSWKHFDRGAHGIVFVDDLKGYACKLLYNPNEDKEVKKRYEDLRSVLPLAPLLYAGNGLVVTELQYGKTVEDPDLLDKYRQIAKSKGVRLDKGKFNIVINEDGKSVLVDY